MLEVIVPGTELYDEKTNLFTETKPQTLLLEHSLLSVSKWESKWKKPFLSKEPRTRIESIDYVRCMTINSNVDPKVYGRIPQEVFNIINDYIDDDMTATTINDRRNRAGGRETVTSELIYYWMIALDIPFECQKWHLNRLFTLIRICNIKNGPQKKMSNKQIFDQQRALNASRRKSFNTSG
jgi:hypothetical protein